MDEEARFLREVGVGAQAWRRRRAACLAVTAAAAVAASAAAAWAASGAAAGWTLAAAGLGIAGVFAVEAAYCHTLAGACLHLRRP
jgi:hypothetical protein